MWRSRSLLPYCLVPLLFVMKATCQVPTISNEPTASNDDARPASVYVYRPQLFFGFGLEPAVYLDEREVAKMDNGSYFLLRVEPGVHTIRSTDKKADLKMEFESGRDYFVRIDLIPTWYSIAKGLPTLKPCEQAISALKDLKPLTSRHVRDKQRVIVPPEEGTEVTCAEASAT